MIYDIFGVAQDKHIPGMILPIDFEKAKNSLPLEIYVQYIILF